MNAEIVAPLLNAFVAATAYVKRSVDGTGATAGFLMGTLIYLAGGPWFWILLMLFFVSSSTISRLTGRRRLSGETVPTQLRGSRRDHVQVFANGAPALVVALVYAAMPGVELEVLFAVAIASANADTWAGELGVLSSHPPVLISSGEPVEAGRSGAISPMGLSAAALGAGIIAVGYGVGHVLVYGVEPAAPAFAVLVGLGGFVGAVLDSFLGATIQAQYQEVEDGPFHDAPISGARDRKPDRGFRFITNDMVNFISGSLAVLIGALALILLR